jgi:hypothetical protein
MAGLWLPDSRLLAPELLVPGRKPTGRVKLDWSHPYPQGLVNAAEFYIGPYDQALGNQIDIAGATLTHVLKTGSGADGHASLGITPVLQPSSVPAISMAFDINTTQSTGSLNRVAGVISSTTSSLCIINMGRSNNGDLEVFVRAGAVGGYRFYTSLGGINDGRTHHIFTSCRSDGTGGYIAIDGASVPITVAVSSGFLGLMDVTADPFYVGRLNNRGSALGDLDCEIAYFRIWNTYTPVSSGADMTRDPYQMLVHA